jgi:tRNA modification GTPase
LNSDIIVLILDGSRSLNPGEGRLIERTTKMVETGGVRCIITVNKIDLKPFNQQDFQELEGLILTHKIVGVSAMSLEGIDKLELAMYEAASGGGVGMAESAVTVTNLRHYSALERARSSLDLSLKTVEAGASSEFVAVDLRSALNSLGEITGAVTTEDILNSIFSKFCIGK